MSDPQQPVPWVAPEAAPGPGPGIEFGGPGARLVGYIVDGLILAAAYFVGIIVSGLLAAVFAALGLLLLLVIFVALFFYFPYFWWKGGQTPGMKVMKIKVVRDKDGGPITGGQAILRLIGYAISSFVFYLGFIWIFIDKRQRGWFDLIAGTVVIKA